MRSPRRTAAAALFFSAALSLVAFAQQPAAPATPPGAPPAAAATPRTARQSAQADLTGYWVAQITEDWRWRMMTPPKGDYMGVPMNADARRVGDAWDPAKDAANGDVCKSFGAGGLMRHPLRVHITWADDNTLKVETDLARQTRLFRFDRRQPQGARSLQGYSFAQWTRPVPPAGRGGGAVTGAAPRGQAFGPGAAAPASAGRAAEPPPPGGLKVVTTNLLAGYLRKNGIPYSENATVTEYYDRLSIFGTDYLQVVTVVDDPAYLTTPFIVSNQFKREPDAAKWTPAPCTIDPPAGTLRREPFVGQ
jgi:hypothetical protein